MIALSQFWLKGWMMVEWTSASVSTELCRAPNTTRTVISPVSISHQDEQSHIQVKLLPLCFAAGVSEPTIAKALLLD